MPALSVSNLTMTFIERNLFTDVSFEVESRDKVGFIGANGVGKTTLFKILDGEISPTSGNVVFAKDTVVGYMEQHACNNPRISIYNELLSVFDYLTDTEQEIAEVTNAIENKDGDLNALVERQTRLIDEFERLGGLTYKSRTRSALLGLGFMESELDMPVGNLSGGQRSKLSLAKLLLSKSNFLLLDEPTNHLDSASREELEKTLADYSGTLLIISHDRYFINKLADRVLVLDKNGITEYLGNYDYYVEHIRTEQTEVKTAAVKKEKPQNDYFLQKQRQSEERKKQTRLKKAEEAIERLDEEIAQTQELLSGEEVAADYEKLIELTNKLEELQNEQEEQYAIWEELSD